MVKILMVKAGSDVGSGIIAAVGIACAVASAGNVS